MTFHVLGCGSNGSGQLGIGGIEDQNVLSEARFYKGDLQVALESQPKSISCGGNHTIILLDSRKAYAAGNADNKVQDKFVELDGEWDLASCGWDFSILVNHNGDVSVVGTGLKGELGLGKKETKCDQLTPLGFRFPDRIASIVSSLNHTVVRLQNGDYYGWGVSRKGQLGNTTEKILWVPTKIDWSGLSEEALPLFKGIAVGRDYTVLYNDREFRLFGNQAKVQSQMQDSTFERKIVKVLSMWSSIHIITEDDDRTSRTVVSYGNNSHGQQFPTSVANVPHFNDFAIGSEHGAGVTTDGVVFAWGWGEHGNCGIFRDRQRPDEVTFDYFNRIYEPKGAEKVIDIACGCATTWVVIKR